MSAISPDMSAPNKVKDSPSFGLEMARYINSEWSSEGLSREVQNIDLMRSHLEGKVDPSHLQRLFKKEKDASTLGVNWDYDSPVPKFINSIVQSISYDKYRVSVSGIDNHSQDMRSQFKREKKKAMLIREDAEEVSRRIGMDFNPKGFIPESAEELDLFMQLNYKQAHEIAAELGIQKVYDYNSWRETFSLLVTDLALNGKAVAKVDQDPNMAVQFRYVDIRNFIYSDNLDKTRNGSGCYYFGEYKRITIGELDRLAAGSIPTKVLKSMAGYDPSHIITDTTLTDSDRALTTSVMYFCFKANRYDMKKKRSYSHGRYKYITKDDYWDPGKNSEYVRVPYEVWYEGIYLPGTEYVIKYGLMDNMLRDPNNHRKSMAPYVMYDTQTESIGRQIVNIADEIYITKIKLRQLLIKLKPKGVAIDVNALGGLEGNDGEKISVMEQVRLYADSGDLLFSGKSLIDDQYNSRPPIHDLPDSQYNKLTELITVHNNLVSQLHDLTGISPQAVGAPPPDRTSTAVFEGSMSASQKSFNNVYVGMLDIQKRSGEVILARLHSAAAMGDMDNIIRSIMGEFTYEKIREMAKINYYQYRLNIDLKPTDQERQELRNIIGSALQTGTMTASDLVDIEEVDNIRLAKQIIRLREKAAIKRQQEAEKMKGQQELAMAKQKHQQDLQRLQMESKLSTESSIALERIKAQVQSAQNIADLKQIQMKGRIDMAIAKIKEGGAESMMAKKEDREDRRTYLRASQESQLAHQKNANTGPQTFMPPQKKEDQVLPKE